VTRELIWQEEAGLLGCSACGWVFRPGKPSPEKTPEEIAREFTLQRDRGFADHVCAEHPRRPPDRN
jgi:hypothetical protein